MVPQTRFLMAGCVAEHRGPTSRNTDLLLDMRDSACKHKRGKIEPDNEYETQ